MGNNAQIPGVICDRCMFLCLSSFFKMMYFINEYMVDHRVQE